MRKTAAVLLAAVSETAGSIIFSALPADLSAYPGAAALIGSRPIYTFTVRGQESDGTVVTTAVNFPAGSVFIILNYIPASAEITGNLFMVYVDGNGAVSWIDKSSHNNGSLHQTYRLFLSISACGSHIRRQRTNQYVGGKGRYRHAAGRYHERERAESLHPAGNHYPCGMFSNTAPVCRDYSGTGRGKRMGENDSGKWLYYRGGRALTGWQELSGKWYYFYKDGSMAADTTIGSYRIGADGSRTDA